VTGANAVHSTEAIIASDRRAANERLKEELEPMLSSHSLSSSMKILVRRGPLLVLLLYASQALAQRAPDSPDRPWHAPGELSIEKDAKSIREPAFNLDQAKAYSLAELIDLAETHNPETRFAWERARAQAAALGIARSELYPTLAAAALSETARLQVYFGTRFYRQNIQDFQVGFALNYTVFDFGARAGRIDAAKAEVLVANFAFNDTHRQVIYQVEQAYYQLLNATGQEDAAQASLANAEAVQQAAEDRLDHGLATLPDVLEAKSATAQAEYQLQAVIGAEEIAHGDLATALGISPTATIRVQPLNELSIPDATTDTVNLSIDRAFAQRPDLMERVAEIRSANARVKESRAAYYPSLTLNASPAEQAWFGSQQDLPWGYTAGVGGALTLNLNWTVFDGGARRSTLTQAQANAHAAEAQVNVTRDQIADQVWTAYSNLNTAFRQRQAAIALLDAASKSYDAALESYNYGLRNLLDVTAAQQTLAQARSADVFSRTQVLTALAVLAFQTGGSIQPGAPRP
jgi:outer membrane protein